MKQLILNADDFGLTRGINQGIIRAHREGILTSTTLMATAPAFDDACVLARANPQLSVGCHVVLVGGKSVLSPPEVPSLADKEGKLPASVGMLVAKMSLGKIHMRDVEREVQAQIEKIRAAGIEPSHFDSHKHAHAHPMVMEAIGKVAQACRIKRVRNPVERLGDSWRGAGLSKQLAVAAAVQVVARRFRSLARKYGLRAPERFLGLATTGRLGPLALGRMIETLPEGISEIMLHPGIWDEDLARTGSRLQRQRELELEGLLDPDLKRTVEKEGIELIGYCGLN